MVLHDTEFYNKKFLSHDKLINNILINKNNNNINNNPDKVMQSLITIYYSILYYDPRLSDNCTNFYHLSNL